MSQLTSPFSFNPTPKTPLRHDNLTTGPASKKRTLDRSSFADEDSVRQASSHKRVYWPRSEPGYKRISRQPVFRKSGGLSLTRKEWNATLKEGERSVPNPDTSEEVLAEAHVGLRPDGVVTQVDYRIPWTHTSDFSEDSLVLEDTPRRLFIALFHCMLRWLDMLYRYYLHGDVSIGNFLVTMTSVTLDKFDLHHLHHNNEEWESSYAFLGLEDEPRTEDVQRQIKSLADILKQLGVSKECYGSIVDSGDLASDVPTYWEAWHSRQKSGTYEFMSADLIQDLELRIPHLHSPDDDLISFYFVCQWAAVFHSAPDGTPGLKRLQEHLVGTVSQRGHGFITYTTIASPRKLSKEEYGPFLAECQPLLQKWHQSLQDLIGRWHNLHTAVKKRAHDAKKRRDFYIRNFIVFAREGVTTMGRLILEHHDKFSDSA